MVAGSKICPAKIGRPRASTRNLIRRQQCTEIASLECVNGVVLPNPGNTPERNRVQSKFMKKNVLFRPL